MSIERRAVARAAAGVLEDGAAPRGMIGVLEAQGELARGLEDVRSRLGIAPRSEPGPFATFGEQMQAVHRAALYPGRVDARLTDVQRRATPAGASEQVPADGGFLVSPEFAERLIARVYSTGQFLQRTTSVPISKPGSTGAKIAGFDEQSRENGLRFGGVLSYWQNEADEVLATKPKFREIELSLKKLTGLCYATDELVSDAALLESSLTTAFTGELRFRMEHAALFGTGQGQPAGIMSSPALITVAAQAGQAPGTIVADNVLDMWARLWGPSKPKAIWMTSSTLESQLPKLAIDVGTGGSAVPLYVPTRHPNLQPFNLLLGRPVVPCEYSPAPGTPGDLLLVDPSQYLVLEKSGIQFALSIHVRFLTSEQAFRFIWRIDGQPAWLFPVTPFNGGATHSPFVCVAQR